MDPNEVTTVRTTRPQSNGLRVEVLLGTACLILAIACLILAGTLAIASRAILAKLSSMPVSPNASSTAPTPVVTPANNIQTSQTVTPEVQHTAEIKTWIALGNKELNSENPNYSKAEFDFKRALELDENNQEAKAGLNRATRAQLAEDRILNDHSDAVVRPTATHHELSQDEREAQTWVDLGNKELNTSDNPNYDSAIQYFKLALAVDSKNAAARKGLARAEKAKQAEAAILGGHT
jgi:tetratricopeptide (TPR) repeat protein